MRRTLTSPEQKGEAMRIFRRRCQTAAAPTPAPLAHARTRCAVLECTAPHTQDTHGWRTCSVHAPRVVSVAGILTGATVREW